MEFPAYLAITLLCAAVMVWCVIMSGRKPGVPVTGLLAYKEPARPAPPTVEEPRAGLPARPNRERTVPPQGPFRPEPSGRWNGDR